MNDQQSTLRVHDLDIGDRPREKAMRMGVASLTDTELLAIVLGSGTRGMSVIDLAKFMLARCDNSLNRLASLSVRDLCARFKGVGPAKAISLLSALQLGMRCNSESTLRNPVIASAADVASLLGPALRNLDHEEFHVLMLSQANRVKDIYIASRGGIASTVVDVRLIMKQALLTGAVAIICVHNHPSENNKPSGPDDSLTRRIADAAATLDIRMLDHVIIAGPSFYSYRDNGRL